MHIFEVSGARNIRFSQNLFKKKGPVQTMMCILVAGLFLFNVLMAEVAGALVNPVDFPRTGPTGSGAPQLLAEFDAGSLTLPENLGKIDYRHIGSSAKTVIHIQDAHCNYNVQKVIGELLDHLNTSYGIRAVNLEGGVGAYDLTPFTEIEGEDIRVQVTEYFLKSGVLNGAEFYAINNENKIDLWGVEDKELYLGNLKAYRDSKEYKPVALGYIQSMQEAVNELKKHIHGKEISELNAKYDEYKNGELGLLEYLGYLKVKAEASGISLDAYPNLAKLSKTAGIEKKIDLKKANRERDTLIENFEKVMSVNEIAELNVAITNFKKGDTKREKFYDYLRTKAKELKVNTADYPELFKYDSYVSAFSGVDAVAAKQEIILLDEAIRETFYTTQKERKLDEVSRKLAITEDLFSLNIKDSFYRYYLDNKESFKVSAYLPFIEKEAQAYGIQVTWGDKVSDLDGYIENISLFYDRSRERDAAFYENLSFDNRTQQVAVLITGGFHTERLMKLFKDKGISCISVIPAYRGESTGTSSYYQLLSGGSDPISEALSPFVSNMQVASILTELARDAWDPTHYKAILAAKDSMQLMIETGHPLRVYSPDNEHSIRIHLTNGEITFERDPETTMEEERVNIMQLVEMYGVRPPQRRATDRPQSESQVPGAPEIEVYDGINRLIQLLALFTISDESAVPSTFVIPDLHGNMLKLDNALARVTDRTEEIVFMGDYMDRGPDGLKVMNKVMELCEERRVMPLMGNHDLMFIMAMMGDEWGFQKWLENGGLNLLEEAGYQGIPELMEFVKGAMPGLQMGVYNSHYPNEYALLRQAVMQDKTFIKIANWMKQNLVLYYIGRNGVFYVHGGMPMDEGGNITLAYTADNGLEYDKLAALAKLEEDMKRGFAQNDTESRALKFLLRGVTDKDIAEGRMADEVHPQRRSPLWVRYADREGKNSPELSSMVMMGREEVIMHQIGLSMMIVGHTPVMDPIMDLLNLNNRIFYIDRDYKEVAAVVVWNDQDGMQYATEGPSVSQIMDKEAFDKQREVARVRAREVLQEIKDRYIAGPSTDLLGKLFDAEKTLVKDIRVSRDGDRPSINLSNAADGSRVFDKYEDPVESLALIEGRDRKERLLKDKALHELRDLKTTFEGLEEEKDTLEYKVLIGALEVLETAQFSMMHANDYGIMGASDDSGKVPHIYLCDTLTEEVDILTISMFHEAAEIYLARNPVPIPEGLDAHKLLRGASKTERKASPGSFRKGIQDEFFGELNEEFTYKITHAQGDFLYDDEVRLISAFLALHGNDFQLAEKILTKDTKVQPVSLAFAKAFLNMSERYKEARKAHDATKNFAETLAHDNMYQALSVIRKILSGQDHLIKRYLRSSTEGGYTALQGVQEIRVQILLEKFVEGDIESVTVIPTPRNKALSDLRRTVEANLAVKNKRGTILDLPAHKEIIIVGDLHTRVNNLKKILSHNNNLQKIRSGEAILLILGDAPHTDVHCMSWRDEEDLIVKLEGMESSIEILEFIHRLKRENPDNVHYVVGNHDYISPKAGKSVNKYVRIPQGLLFQQTLLDKFGPEYTDAYNQLIASSPLMARTPDGLVAVHAGPIKSARTMQDIRKVNILDEEDPIVHEATWMRWQEKYGASYDEADVHSFLDMVDGKILVVGHTPSLISRGDFYRELMPGTHYVTIGGLDIIGYLSFKDGKLEPVSLRQQLGEEETALTEDVNKIIEESAEERAEEETMQTIRDRIKKLESRFGPLTINGVLGRGTFGTVLDVEDKDGLRFALKIPGGVVGEDRNEMYRARMALKINDVPFGVVMAEESRKSDVEWMPHIIDVGIIDNMPYVAMKIIEDYHKINLSLLAELEREEVHSVMEQIARIVTALETEGAIMFDAKLENFGYKNGKVILLDTGACNVNRNLLDDRHLRKIEEELGIRTTEENWTGDDVLKNSMRELMVKLDSLQENEITDKEIESVTNKARAEARVEELYSKTGEVLKNVRHREKPVVVFMQHPTADGEGAQFTLIRRLERELRKKYDTDNLRVMLYNGTQAELDSAMGRAEDMLKSPGAKAVVYVSPEMHPGKVDDNVLYIKEECPWGGDMLSMVGPHVALALGIVNFDEGDASVDLLRDIEHILKLMIGDKETLKYMNNEGVEVFLRSLLAGISMIKMKKIDLEKMRDVVEAQEQLLHSL
ncbi:MAG: metallophosphoesterase [Candidatus Omnitrophota bacterium]